MVGFFRGGAGRNMLAFEVKHVFELFLSADLCIFLYRSTVHKLECYCCCFVLVIMFIHPHNLVLGDKTGSNNYGGEENLARKNKNKTNTNYNLRGTRTVVTEENRTTQPRNKSEINMISW